MIKDFEYLERVVSAINLLQIPDAEVIWNAEINGRQFDVIIKFQSGPYRFLILIEVKDHVRSIPAEDIEAFITKAKDHGANKIVFVTSSNFQSGAIDVAKRHAVDLFQVSFNANDLSQPHQKTSLILGRTLDGKIEYVDIKSFAISKEQGYSIGDPVLVNNIQECVAIYADGSTSAFPTEPAQMRYYVERTKLSDGRSIDEVLSEVTGVATAKGVKSLYRVSVDPPLLILPPDEFFLASGTVSAFELKIVAEKMRPVMGPHEVDPALISPVVEYRNVITNEVLSMDASTLPVGESRLEAGDFYFGYYPLRYFYCEKIDGELMSIYMVESFQNGTLIQVHYKQKIEYSRFYIAVRDEKIRKRLRSRLAKMLAR